MTPTITRSFMVEDRIRNRLGELSSRLADAECSMVRSARVT
jgi:hypothetical protein